ncbi:MAG: pilin [Candidatus Moranbacteria bacterium]|nr:pilin [Candidatus Moranbacteria bacterium]
MKNKKNKIKTIFIASVILLMFFSFFQPTLAQYQNQEKIPGAQQQQKEFIPYLKDVINFGFAIVGILALFMLIIGAYQYLMAAGSGNAADAKDTITSALFGLILGLTAWIILQTINPDLVNMNPIKQIQSTTTQAQ